MLITWIYYWFKNEKYSNIYLNKSVIYVLKKNNNKRENESVPASWTIISTDFEFHFSNENCEFKALNNHNEIRINLPIPKENLFNHGLKFKKKKKIAHKTQKVILKMHIKSTST